MVLSPVLSKMVTKVAAGDPMMTLDSELTREKVNISFPSRLLSVLLIRLVQLVWDNSLGEKVN